MRKNILGILAFVMAFVMIGSVSATALDGILFTSPTTSSSITSTYVHNTIDVEWTNDYGYEITGLHYIKGECNSSGTWASIQSWIGPTMLSKSWSTPSVDGTYCLRLQTASLLAEDKIQVIVDNTDPTASFTWTGNQFKYETISFDANASSDGSGSGIKSYAWDFGDGETGTGVNPTHEYNEAGDYDVTLTVTDNADNVKSLTQEVEIADITPEEETFAYETGILDIAPEEIYGEIETSLTGVACSIVPGSDQITGITITSDGTKCIVDETSIPYSERGVHNVIIRAAGSSEIKYYSVTITVYTWWITLNEGWNLFSIPMMPESTTLSSVLGGIKNSIDKTQYSIFQYDAVAKDWKKAKPTTSSWTNTDGLNIKPGYGYFIKMTETAELKGYGDITPAIGGSMLSATVANGWNLIGHYGLSDLTIFQALSSLRLNIENRYYDAITTSDGLHRYGGYWMTAKFLPEGTTSYTPSQSAIDSVLGIVI